MQVSVESTAGLERRLTVELPEEGVAREVGSRLDRLVQSVQIPGFRPGKAPMKIVVQRFGAAVREEVVGELVRSSFADALASESLRPAGDPALDLVESAPGAGVRYTAVFEVYPDIRLDDLESIEVRRPVAEVQEADVDRTIDTLRRQRREWREAARGAQEGDRITFSLQGEVDGRPLDGGFTSEDRVLELGAGHALPALEQGLIGLEPGGEHDLEVRYPDDYAVSRLAGKTAALHVAARKVEEGMVPEVDAGFIRSLGVESGEVDDLRREVRTDLERELASGTAAITTNRLLEALLERHPVEVPDVLVAEELQRSRAEQTAAGRQGSAGEPGSSPEPGADPGSEVAEVAEVAEAATRRRLQLGLILAQLVSDRDTPPDPSAVRAEVERMVARYEDPARMVSWFYADTSRLRPVVARLAEREAVEAALARVRVVDEPTGFDELMNPRQTSGAPS